MKKFSINNLGPFLACVAIANIIFLSVLAMRHHGWLQAFELKAYDLSFWVKPAQSADHRVVLIGLTEVDIAKLGYPVPDQILTDVLARLKALNANVIGVDIYRDVPVQPGYEHFQHFLQETKNLIWVSKLANKDKVIRPPKVLEGSDQIGFNDIVDDAGGVVRRALLFLDDGNSSYTSFPLQLALRYLSTHGVEIGSDPVRSDYIRIGNATIPAFEGNDGPYNQADAAGYQFLINYKRFSEPLARYSFDEVLSGKVTASEIGDKIVLVGVTADSVNDVFMTPIGNGHDNSFQIYGLELHGHIVSQLLRFGFGEDAPIRVVDKQYESLWIWLWAMAGGVAAFSVRSIFHSFAVALLLPTLLLLISLLAWMQNWWLPFAVPMLSYGLAGSGSGFYMARYLRRKNSFVRNIFGRYMSDEIVQKLLESPEGLKLGGQSLMATIMFTDLRGFSAISERLAPETVVDMLNIYLREMTKVIFRHGGSINEFMGDGILIVFGVPTNHADDAKRALLCAVEMQLAMSEVNARNRALGLPKLEMGIGIHTGKIVAGNVGSDMRAKYAVVGSHVNLASRVESFTIGGQVLATEATLDAAPNTVVILSERLVPFKGFAEPVKIYDIGGIAGTNPIMLPSHVLECRSLANFVPVVFESVDGKHISEEQYGGNILAVGEKGFVLETLHQLAVFSSIKLEITEGEVSFGFYGKVLGKKEGNVYELYFTSLSDEVRAKLQSCT